jgi:hypothetical protein
MRALRNIENLFIVSGKVIKLNPEVQINNNFCSRLNEINMNSSSRQFLRTEAITVG